MITEIIGDLCRQAQSRIHLLYSLASTQSTSIMLFQKHPFGILALNFLLQARQTFAEEDHTLFETEFRLMIIVGFPDRDMATVEGEDGVFWPGKHEDKENKDWAMGTKTPEGQGNYRVNYMAWSRRSDKERTLWLHDKEKDKDSGRKVHYHNCTHWDYQLILVYGSLGPRSQSSSARLVYLGRLGTRC